MCGSFPTALRCLCSCRFCSLHPSKGGETYMGKERQKTVFILRGQKDVRVDIALLDHDKA